MMIEHGTARSGDVKEPDVAVEEPGDRRLVGRVQGAHGGAAGGGITSNPRRRQGNVSRSGSKVRAKAFVHVEERAGAGDPIGIGQGVLHGEPHVGGGELGQDGCRRRTRRGSGPRLSGWTTTSICSGSRPKSHRASITSSALFISVAESIEIFGPIRQVGCRSASSGVTPARSRADRPRNGPPAGGEDKLGGDGASGGRHRRGDRGRAPRVQRRADLRGRKRGVGRQGSSKRRVSCR